MKITAIHDAFPSGQYQRCPECDVLFILPALSDNQDACCPRCRAKVVRGQDWSMTRLAALAVAMLLLMPFAFTEPLISIRLLGTPICCRAFGKWRCRAISSPPVWWRFAP